MVNSIITGLDLGSSNIRAACSRVRPSGEIQVLALENVSSNGFDSGNVVNFDAASDDVHNVIKKIERKIRARIRSVSVVMGGSGIHSLSAGGMIALSKKPREIWQADVDRCVKQAGMVHVPSDREVIEKAILDFYINEGDYVENPLGIYATKLGVKLFVVTAEIAKIKNIYKCVEHAGLILKNMAFSPTALSASILNKDDHSVNIAIVDIGSHMASVSFFKMGRINSYRYIYQGSRDIDDQGATGSFLKKIGHLFTNARPDKIYITGGGALKENLLEQAEEVFKVKCELGRVRLKGCLLSPSDGLIHTSSLGIVIDEGKKHILRNRLRNPFEKMLSYANSLIEEYL